MQQVFARQSLWEMSERLRGEASCRGRCLTKEQISSFAVEQQTRLIDLGKRLATIKVIAAFKSSSPCLEI